MEQWFSRGLVKWYNSNKRDLPWRNQQNPYYIWLSEIILQQTQVKQGLAYYLKFVKHYPTVKKLALAHEDEVLKDWQGLGYYSRARNLQAAAKYIAEEHKGVFPDTFEEILRLKGVGDYTAAAIASFAYDLPHAVVDGNVYRLLSRVFGIHDPIDSTAGKKKFAALAQELLDKKHPGLHNQAIMEFGSQYCKPVNPDCPNCIFKSRCYAFAHNEVARLPVKSKKTAVTNRYLNYLVLADKNNNIVVEKRSGKDIWQGLYQFPLIETQEAMDFKKLAKLKELKQLTGGKGNLLYTSREYKHLLSHRNLFAVFYVLKLNTTHPKDKLTSPPGSLTKFAFPRLIEKFMEDCSLPDLF